MRNPTHNSNEQDRIERLKRRLYSRTSSPVFEDERSDIAPGSQEVNEEWKQADGEATDNVTLPHVRESEIKKNSLFSKIFIGAIIFFVVSIGIAFFMYAGGLNRISPNNVDISIVGPVSVSGGEAFTLEMVVRNNNAVDLEDVVLTVRFPEGARTPENMANPLIVQRIDLGTIPARQTGRRTVKAVLFGEKDSLKDIQVTADYNIRSSNASYQKEKTYQIAIKSSPLIAAIDYPKEVNAGAEIEFNIELTSNTNAVLEDVIVRAEYPFGFVFRNSDPTPFYETNVWHVGDINPLEKRQLTIRGVLEGQHEEERTFRIYVGRVSEDDDRQIGINLTSQQLPVTIMRPQLALDLDFYGAKQDEDVVIPAGGSAQAIVRWRNNLPTNLIDVSAEARVKGEMYRKESTYPHNNGYFRSSDSTVLWNKQTTRDFSQVTPGTTGTLGLSFSLRPSDASLIALLQNPEVTVEVIMTGFRVIEGGLPEQITSTVERTVKVSTETAAFGRVTYTVGPFENSGPIPPKVDTPTTYTITWSLTNTFNNVSGGRMVATLPPYVKWLGVTSPATERISFNPISQEIIWDVGEIKRGTGFMTSPREASFQIEVTPSITHDGMSPVILNEAKFTGRDIFTGTSIEKKVAPLDTDLPTDPNFDSRSGHVVK